MPTETFKNLPMKTEDRLSLLGVILAKLRPEDVADQENRLLITERIENMLQQNSWTRPQFSALMRREVRLLRVWLGDTCDMTTETLHDFCRLLGVSLGDLVAE